MASSGSRSLKVAQYLLLPQILPRFAALVFGGFAYLAYFVAQVYRGVRLLPEGHPYLNPSEIGNYSIPNVVAAAGSHLKYKKENIDQVIIFYFILLGMVLLGLQIVMLLVGMFAPHAMAMSLTDYFGNSHLAGWGRDPFQDLAFIMLDRVFGIPGIFDSCVSLNVPCYMAAPDDTWDSASTVYTPPTFPWPFHHALHAMFSFYSIGLLLIAMMIILYMVIVIVAETAQTGVPFGKRFNKVWAPIRLVVALGLLIPVSNGLNSAQYIVLYAAKLGSNFATNGWNQFNAQLSNGMMISEEMVAYPKTPSPGSLLQFMMLAHACKAINEGVLLQEDRPKGWKATAQGKDCPVSAEDQQNGAVIDAYLVKSSGNGSADAVPLSQSDYSDARDFFNNGDITIRIGDRGCGDQYNQAKGHTVPTCGELVLTAPTQDADQNAGAYIIQEGYYELIRYMWGDYSGGAGGGPKIWARWGFCNENIGGNSYQGYPTSQYADMVSGSGDLILRVASLSTVQDLCPSNPVDSDKTIETNKGLQFPLTNEWLSGTYNNYMYGLNDTNPPDMVTGSSSYSPGGTSTAIMTNIIRSGVNAERALARSGKYNMPIDLLDRGWAGAGLWYNRIAQANGAITGAAQETPKILHYPSLMEVVVRSKLRDNKNVSSGDLFRPIKGERSSMQFQKANEAESAVALSRIYDAWKNVSNEGKPATGNIIYDFLNTLFGTQGLFDLRDPGNQNVHPLALMTSMGKSLVEASIRNLGLAAAGTAGSGLLGSSAEAAGVTVGVASGILFNIVMMTLGAGIILYYVLPFMPFVYFFFAVGSWIKEVFEAMVGVPLWALAHIRIDGDGLPGEAARSGYFMIFEIFLRPIMIVFGLVASVSVFASMASVLNAIFDIAVVNAGGTNFANMSTVSLTEFARGPIDQLFYTIMYAVLMYIIAMSSFKMIDLIPNQIMRWLGVSVNAFASQTGDSASSLMQNVQQQGIQKVGQAVSGIKQGAEGVGKIATSATK